MVELSSGPCGSHNRRVERSEDESYDPVSAITYLVTVLRGGDPSASPLSFTSPKITLAPKISLHVSGVPVCVEKGYHAISRSDSRSCTRGVSHVGRALHLRGKSGKSGTISSSPPRASYFDWMGAPVAPIL